MITHTITHTDLDGAACHALLCAYLGDAPTQHHWSSPVTDEVDRAVAEALVAGADTILIADLSPSPECCERLDAQLGSSTLQSVTVADHHVQSTYLAERYPWVHCDTRLCGVQVLAQTLGEQTLGRWGCSESWLATIAARDLWRKDDPRWTQSEQLHSLLQLVGPELWSAVAQSHEWHAREWAADSQHVAQVQLPAMALLNARRETQAAAIKRAVERAQQTLDSEGRRVTWTVAGDWGIVSELAHQLLHRGPGSLDHQYVAILLPAHGKVSLRSKQSRSGADVARIAKAHGGGGHAQAAGYPVDIEDWSCLETVLP